MKEAGHGQRVMVVGLPGPQKLVSFLIKHIYSSIYCLSKSFLETLADTVLPNSTNHRHQSNISSDWTCGDNARHHIISNSHSVFEILASMAEELSAPASWPFDPQTDPFSAKRLHSRDHPELHFLLPVMGAGRSQGPVKANEELEKVGGLSGEQAPAGAVGEGPVLSMKTPRRSTVSRSNGRHVGGLSEGGLALRGAKLSSQTAALHWVPGHRPCTASETLC